MWCAATWRLWGTAHSLQQEAHFVLRKQQQEYSHAPLKYLGKNKISKQTQTLGLLFWSPLFPLKIINTFENKAWHNENEYTGVTFAWRSNVVLRCFTHFSTLLFLVWFVQQCSSTPLSRTRIIIPPWDAHLSAHRSESRPFILLFKQPSRPQEDGGD